VSEDPVGKELRASGDAERADAPDGPGQAMTGIAWSKEAAGRRDTDPNPICFDSLCSERE
jgi:hypothetical protein